jgi:D-sedoheptulose 7-phosphate isomerase
MKAHLNKHLNHLLSALSGLGSSHHRLEAWGEHLAGVLGSGGRLLACGNGGSAAQAQHLTAELVGRYQGERRPLSAIALCVETSSLTAIGNDYGFQHAFARQVRAHGRRGDILMLLSTSGRSENLLEAAQTARDIGMVTWAFTGPAPNPLAACCDDALAVAAATPATVQEIHLAAVHMLCAAVDEALRARTAAGVDGQMNSAAPAAWTARSPA